MIYNYYKYKDIHYFVNNTKSSSTPRQYSIIFKCDGLTDSNDSFNYTPNCFGCLFCCMNNELLKSKFANHFDLNNLNNISNNLFSGNIIEPLKAKNFLKNKFTSLTMFTKVNETDHIQPWAAGLLNSSSHIPCRIGMEVNVSNESYLRDGRLDICAITNNYLLVLESKISLEDALKDERFIEQFDKYIDEIESACNKHNINYNLLLLIGGNETDLLPEWHYQCSSKIGNASKRFYNIILEKNIKFISANALWGLALKNFLTPSTFNWDILIPSIFNDPNTYGLLTCGTISYSQGEFKICPLS